MEARTPPDGFSKHYKPDDLTIRPVQFRCVAADGHAENTYFIYAETGKKLGELVEHDGLIKIENHE